MRVIILSEISTILELIVVVSPLTNKFPLIITCPSLSKWGNGSIIKSEGPKICPDEITKLFEISIPETSNLLVIV